jgi:hypothetical protein
MKPNKLKILTVFKNPQIDEPTACHQGLGVTATRLTLAFKSLGLDADCFPVKNGEYLWQKLSTDWKEYNHVILCAPFIDATFLKKLFSFFKNKKFALIYHSNLGFLTQDRFAVLSLGLYFELEESCPNFRIATNCLEFSKSIEQATGKKFLYLPNLFPLPNKMPSKHFIWTHKHTLNIGLFGAARILKNWLTAGVATMIISKTLQAETFLHINTSRDENAGNLRENLRSLIDLNPHVHIIEVPWLGHEKFLEYLPKLDLLMQPSFTETFNNVTAEGVSCTVPSVVSDAIVWAPENWKARSDSATDVARVGLNLLHDSDSYKNGWKKLKDYNEKAIEEWFKWFEIKKDCNFWNKLTGWLS